MSNNQGLTDYRKEQSKFKTVAIVRWQDKTCGAFGFVLNFLWLLSLGDKKSSKQPIIGSKPSADLALLEMTKRETLLDVVDPLS